MTAQEVKTALKAQGWSYLPRTRKGRSYIYAQRKLNGKKIERYICSLAALAEFTIDRLLVKLHYNVLPATTSIGSNLLSSSKQEA
jgi:hypothetical protein